MQFYERVQARIAALPGVADAAVGYGVPAFGFPTGRGFCRGRPPRPPRVTNRARRSTASRRVTSTPSAPASCAGAIFFPRTRRGGAPRVIILESMARTLFPARKRSGRRPGAILARRSPSGWKSLGVAEDVRFLNISDRRGPFKPTFPSRNRPGATSPSACAPLGPAAPLLGPIRKTVGELESRSGGQGTDAGARLPSSAAYRISRRSITCWLASPLLACSSPRSSTASSRGSSPTAPPRLASG